VSALAPAIRVAHQLQKLIVQLDASTPRSLPAVRHRSSL